MWPSIALLDKELLALGEKKQVWSKTGRDTKCVRLCAIHLSGTMTSENLNNVMFVFLDVLRDGDEGWSI